MITRWPAALLKRLAGLAAMVVGAILIDVQVVRITLQPVAVEPWSAVPAKAMHLRDATPP